MSRRYVRLPADGFWSDRNEDGGWGEAAPATFTLRPSGVDGAPRHGQTAWALLALLAAGGASPDGVVGDAIERGAGYLVGTQEEDGQWQEPEFTGTGFPGDFYIEYHLYRNCWPLSALGGYARRM